MTDAKIRELEGQVLALRSAAQEFVDKVDRGEARSKRSYAAFRQALTDTAQAGREAEARIKMSVATQLGSDIGELAFLAKSQGEVSGFNLAAQACLSYAQRLRNGGSDGE